MSFTFDSRSFFGAGSSGFSIQYPLYALKRAKDKYLGIPMDANGGQPGVIGIPVFTSADNLARYLTQCRVKVKVKEFDRVGMFRLFLRSLPESETKILFDLLPDRNGNLHSAHVFTPEVLLSHFLPDVSLHWSYPVYVLRYKKHVGWACLEAKPNEGSSGSWLVVFTDEDLVERAATAPAGQPFVAEPVKSKQEFATIIRSIANVCGALFDPPSPGTSQLGRWAVPKRMLLAGLEMEL